MSNSSTSLPQNPAPSRLSIIPPWALVVIAIISVQFGASVAKSLFPVVGPAGVVFLRTTLAAVIFAVLWRTPLRGRTRQVYLYAALYGAIISAMMLSFYAAIDRVPLGITVAIAFAGPLGVAVLGSRKAVDLLWVALAAVGVLLLSPITDTTIDPFGMLLAILSGVTWAVYILLTKRINRVMPGNDALGLGMIAAAIVALPLGIGGAAKILTDPTLIFISVVVALFSSAVPFALEFQALKSLSSRSFGLLVSLEPVVAAIMGLLMLGEALGIREIIGIGLVTVATIATARE